jgi:hypothetical protein
MSKRGLRFVGVFGLLGLVLSAPAAAASETQHRWAGSAQVALIEQGEGFPNPGSTLVSAGVNEMKVDGGKVMRGATVIHLTVTGGDLTSGLDYRGDVRWYFTRGSIRLKEAGALILQPDSSVTFAGEFEVAGGTGAFRGASGNLTYEGFSPGPGAVAVGEGEGTISY